MIGLIACMLTGFASFVVAIVVEMITHASKSPATWGQFYRAIHAFAAFGVGWSCGWILAARHYSDDINIGSWSVSIMMAANIANNIRYAVKHQDRIQA